MLLTTDAQFPGRRGPRKLVSSGRPRIIADDHLTGMYCLASYCWLPNNEAIDHQKRPEYVFQRRVHRRQWRSRKG